MTTHHAATDRSTAELQSVQAELLLPHEIDTALATRSVVYLPLGSIEFHSAHLPIGLDGLNAHGVCTRVAATGGGIVLPTLYYGTGGGHTAYPWTIMAPAETIDDLLRQSLRRLSDFGVQLAVLFTGHFSNEQLALIDRVAAEWNDAWNGGTTSLRVLALSVNRTTASIPPDHAGIFETSLLSAMWPDRIDIDRLPSLADGPANDPDGDVMGTHRHDPTHPLHGVFGPDPRVFDPTAAPTLLDEIVTWTVRQVQHASSAG